MLTIWLLCEIGTPAVCGGGVYLGALAQRKYTTSHRTAIVGRRFVVRPIETSPSPNVLTNSMATRINVVMPGSKCYRGAAAKLRTFADTFSGMRPLAFSL